MEERCSPRSTSASPFVFVVSRGTGIPADIIKFNEKSVPEDAEFIFYDKTIFSEIFHTNVVFRLTTS